MCAIAATLDLKNHTIFSQVFPLLKHRGPDESAIVDEGWVQLGCHRLAIVDLDGGAQPLRSADNRWLLVFNGEIYNFHLLREKFSNYPFRTQTDGEVLFPLIEREGPAGLNQLRGMFAFVLVNLATRDFLAARDPFGIKPLYFLQIDNGLTIASELKSFASLAGRPRFVPPGHFITRKGVERYYRAPSRKWFPCFLPVRQVLEEALERHVPSNGPYGVLLSGGLDSSIVAALATRLNPNLTAYTISMPGAADEIAASELAKELKIHHIIFHVSRDEVLATLPVVVRHLESFNPIMVRNAVPLYLLAKKARKDVKVLLSGDGADELFAGYDYLSLLPQRFWPEAIECGFNNLHRTELQRADRMTMAHGVELRVPFLDTSLVEVAINLPISEKIRRVKGCYISKWALRQAVADLLPSEICWRDKATFAEGSGIGESIWDRKTDRTGNFIPGRECSDEETRNYFKLWKNNFQKLAQTFLFGQMLPGIPILLRNMDTRSWDSFVSSTRLFVSSLLFGISQLALCRSKFLAVGFSLGIFLISPRTVAFALLGTFIASAWLFYRHQDFRLLMTGYYGVNGALCGLWSEWAVSDPMGAVLLTVIGALLTAKIVDFIVFPLGDAPFCLPPLSLPFLFFVLIGTLTLPSINRVIELVWLEFNPPDQKVARISWVPQPIGSFQSKKISTAWKMYGNGRYADAQRTFEELAIQDPKLAQVHVGLGWSLFKQNNLDAATRFFRKALKLNPGNPYALDGLGWTAFRHSNLIAAWDWFKTARETAPLWADPYTGMGWVSYMRGHYTLAQTQFEKALRIDPDYADALNGLGWTALLTRKLGQARQSFYAALAANAQLTKAHEGLGWALLESGYALESVRIFEEALGRVQIERGAILGLAEARRQLVLQGNWSAGNPAEWEKLVGLWGKSIALLFGLLFLVATEKIWAGLLGFVLATLGAVVCILVAGPVSILWFDLHVSTLALLGILVGFHEPLYLKGLAIGTILGLAGGAIWAAKHFLGIGMPLLEFNMVGLAYLSARRLLPTSANKLTRVFSTE